MSRIDVQLNILIDPFDSAERWLPVARVDPADAVALWRRHDRYTCCTFSLGFVVSLDGVPWNGEALDELQMAGTWLDALGKLFQGYQRTNVWAWEESNLLLSRRGESVDALDVHHAGQVVCPLVTLPLRPLCRAFADAAQAGGAWLDAARAAAVEAGDDALAQALDEQGYAGWAATARDLRRAADRPLPSPPADDPGPLPAAWLAAMVSSRDGLRGADPDLRVDGQTLLHLAIQHRWVEGVEALLSMGAHLDRRDPQGFSPLQQAARRASGRPGPHPIVAALLAYGAEVDPITACLLDDPGGLRAATARGDVSRETVNWWTFCALGREEIHPDWPAALAEAVAAGTPATGRKHGLGGWYETPLAAASGRGRDDVIAVLEGLTRQA